MVCVTRAPVSEAMPVIRPGLGPNSFREHKTFVAEFFMSRRPIALNCEQDWVKGKYEVSYRGSILC